MDGRVRVDMRAALTLLLRYTIGRTEKEMETIANAQATAAADIARQPPRVGNNQQDLNDVYQIYKNTLRNVQIHLEVRRRLGKKILAKAYGFFSEQLPPLEMTWESVTALNIQKIALWPEWNTLSTQVIQLQMQITEVISHSEDAITPSRKA